MKARIPVLATCAAAALVVGCAAASRYRVLTFFFDGVPPPPVTSAAPGGEEDGSGAVRSASTGMYQHGPYAAKLCDTCHDALAMNRMVAANGQLCGRCHELDLSKRYIHGPLATGGCTVCHDPHNSRYRYLLVSDSDDFCMTCHDRAALPADPDHAGEAVRCTDCHDAHMSDQKYLLKAGRG